MTSNREPYVDEHVEDIYDLNYLKKYACPKYQHKREWYLECVECKSKKTCKAGKQAIFIMNNETAPSSKAAETAQDMQKKKTIDMIESIFQMNDPVRYLMETSGNIKPQSLYQRVNVWSRNYPELEEKYHMLEKVRFLWRKPYDSMKIPDILATLYPEKPVEEPKKEEPKVSYTAIAPKSKVITVEPKIEENSDSDSISLEDFLAETAEDTQETESSKDAIQDAAVSSNDISSLSALLKKLEKDISDHEAAIKEIRKQIDAVHTVQKLMAG